MKKGVLFLLVALVFTAFNAGAQRRYEVASPSGRLVLTVCIDDAIEYSVTHDGETMISPSPISLTLDDGTVLGRDAVVRRTDTRSVASEVESPYYKRERIDERYNELKIMFRGDFTLTLRAYDEGVAYRFDLTRRRPTVVRNEQATFNFPGDWNAYIPYANVAEPKSLERQFRNSFERTYIYTPLSGFDTLRLAFLPLLVEAPSGKKICITEADLLDYPGMFLYNYDGGPSLGGMFAPYPKAVEQGGHNMLQGIVTEREDYIARFDGQAHFPWRVVVVSEHDTDLADSDIVYLLATPSRIPDHSWVRPGKVAWEWWNDWNLDGVDFRTGINNDTYKYYIDFASRNGVPYVILDEGWSVNLQADLMQVVPELDLPMLVDYAADRGVGIILWVGYWALDRDMENLCRHYAEMGVKGFKVDFMDRDDQPMVGFNRRIAETAARYGLLVNLHGTYKPTGLNRTYPNVINYEGVWGLEQMKWDPDTDQVTYDVTMPFIRMLAGPLDYTQGAMRNATRGNYRSVYSEPMSQGTRCRQLAEYVIFESPMNMLCDSPSNYMREAECFGFISAVPTVWDDTRVINGEVGKYITIARERDGVWYVGSMTDWNSRTLELDLSFLDEGAWCAEVFADGVNAHRVARDYRREVIEVPTDRKMTIDMAPGGGFAMKITRRN